MIIDLKIKDVSKKLLLTEHIGEGKFHKKIFELTRTLNTQSFIININKKKYLIPTEELIQAILNKIII